MFQKGSVKTLLSALFFFAPLSALASEAAIDRYLAKAEQGDANAQNLVGEMYQQGEEVKRDYEEAVKWFTEAAEQGHADALFNLGMMYGNGWGVERSYPISATLFIEAADLGHEAAKTNVEALREI